MSEDRLYYVHNQWLTYEQAHLYGCTRVRPEILSLYTDTVQLVSIIKDVETNTYYDSENHTWVNSISDLHLYKRLNTIILYKGDQEVSYIGYTDDINSNSANYVEIDNTIVSIISLYNTEGITEHPCEDYIITDGEYISWYDPETELYWDNRDNKKLWSPDPPVISDESDYIIPPNPIPLILVDTFDTDPPLVFSGEYSFREHPHISELTVGNLFNLVDVFSDYDPPIELYADT